MRLVAALLAAGLCGACGGGGAPAGAPKGSQPPSPTRSGEDSELEGYQQQPGYGQQPGAGASPGSAGPATPAGPFAQEPPLTLDEALSMLDTAASELSNAGNDCARACKALGSMERSSDRICELNGQDDPGSRCQRAKERVDAARETLKKRCGSCEP